jgi:hypothetical protein
MGFWQFFWLLIWSYFIIALLMALFQIAADLFRDKELSGWAKALWLIALVFVPIIGAMAYLAVRGDSMAKRHAGAALQAREEATAYIQSVAQPDPAATISSAKALLDSSTITEAEFNQLKAKALA